MCEWVDSRRAVADDVDRIGGGATILVAMLYTAIADVVVAEERATVFFQITAVFLATQLVAGLLGGAMLLRGPWFPLLAALVILVIAAVTVLAFPETVHVHGGKGVQEEERADVDGTPTMRKLWRKAVASLVDVWDFVLSNRSVAVLMLSLTFVVLGRYVGELLLQYSRARYHWTWTRAQTVLAIRNAGSLVTLLAILPAASRYCMQRLGMGGTAKDLWLARWSGVLQIVGSLIIAAAVNGELYAFGLVWYALGAGMVAVIRSLINSLVEEHHVGTVNSLIGFMEMVGMTAAGPLLGKSLVVGLDLGGAWVGLPFIAAGLLFVVSTAILWALRLPNGLRLVESSC
jgi:MFS family permease